MTPTDVHSALTAVSDAVPVPPVDRLGVQRRVSAARRRRTATRALAAAAAVAVVAGGSALALRPGDDPVAPSHMTQDPVRAAAAPVTVLLKGGLTTIDSDGSVDETGLRISHLVGSTADGVVAFSADADLVLVRGETVTRLVDEPVRTAYLQGDAVLYEDYDGHLSRVGTAGVGRVEGGRLMAADADRYVVAGDRGIVSFDATGAHHLWLDDGTQVVHGVDVGGDRIAVRADERLTIFDADGAHSGSIPDDRLGALAPDGSAYAHQTEDRRGVELLDPTSFVATPVVGPTGWIADLRWSGSDLLVVTGRGTGPQTLWRCVGGSDCATLLSEPDGGLGLG